MPSANHDPPAELNELPPWSTFSSNSLQAGRDQKGAFSECWRKCLCWTERGRAGLRDKGGKADLWDRRAFTGTLESPIDDLGRKKIAPGPGADRVAAALSSEGPTA